MSILKNKKFWWVLCVFLFFPIIFNYTALQFSGWRVQGNEDSWISFWGNYSGGILSAFVAYIVANSQVEKQANKELEKEHIIKQINQLPALMRAKIALERYIVELEKIRENVERGILKVKVPEREDFDTEEEYLEVLYYDFDRSRLFTNIYHRMSLPETEDYLDKVVDVALQVDLIKCFEFYGGLFNAVSENTQNKSDLLEELMIQYYVTKLDADTLFKLNNLFMRVQENTAERREHIFNLYKDDMFGFFKEVLEKVNEEIDRVNILKDKKNLK
ncbi:hypothetical protein [Halobacillus sp. K22]|uniref:hypothetical protein n=1 Tax=Halobacillus sp. K22 TaxID=3457431 RepID=UPI003FCCCEAA